MSPNSGTMLPLLLLLWNITATNWLDWLQANKPNFSEDMNMANVSPSPDGSVNCVPHQPSEATTL